jgi:hypothetical protein
MKQQAVFKALLMAFEGKKRKADVLIHDYCQIVNSVIFFHIYSFIYYTIYN